MPGNFCQLCLVIAVLSTAGLMCATSASAASGSSTTVVVDAGHGGHDRGGIPGQRIAEKEMTLDVAQRLKKILAGDGYRVVMTRENDVFIPLGTRIGNRQLVSQRNFRVCPFQLGKTGGR